MESNRGRKKKGGAKRNINAVGRYAGLKRKRKTGTKRMEILDQEILELKNTKQIVG